jgi:hypothetical protein
LSGAKSYGFQWWFVLAATSEDEDELLDFFFSKSVTIKFQGDNCNCISSLQK